MHVNLEPGASPAERGPKDPADTLTPMHGGKPNVRVLHVYRQELRRSLDVLRLEQVQESLNQQRGSETSRRLVDLFLRDLACRLRHGCKHRRHLSCAASICVPKQAPAATPVTIGRVEAPRRNIELKASDPDPDRSLQVSLEIGASDEGWLYQTDTYFRVPHGRLKLREEGAIAQLISYERANETEARESRYRLVPVDDPTGLKDALSDALGVLVVVEKSRRLLLWQGVRIHLDEVRGLGSFIEIEAVADPASDLSAEHHRAGQLQDALAIAPDRIVAFSYSDELLRANPDRAKASQH